MDRKDGASELEKLEAATRCLSERIETLGLGLRYRRRERAADFVTNVQRARRYVERAQRVLSSRQEETSPDLDDAWLLTRIAALTGNLMAGALQVEEDRAESDELLAPGDTEPMRTRDWHGFRGDSASISIPDLLQMLQMQAQTGILKVQLERESVELQFDEGQLVHAFSRNSPAGQRLGEILVEGGAISAEDLERVLERLRESQARFGDVVREEKVVDESDLRAALDQQMQGLFHRLFESSSARYEFREGLEGAAPDRANVNLTRLLLDSARALDEKETV